MTEADNLEQPRVADVTQSPAYTLEAFGQVVREERQKLSPRVGQEAFGKRAGYHGGAGVTISRIEAGLSRPNPERLAGIAEGLGTDVDNLLRLAAERTGQLEAEERHAEAGSGRDKESSRARLMRLQHVIEARTRKVITYAEAANAAHDAARDDFFLPFVRTAAGISDAPSPPQRPRDLAVPEPDTSAQETAQKQLTQSRLRLAEALSGAGAGAFLGGGVGAGAAYASFAAAATWGTASTGAAIAGLSGVAASNAALALLGGGTLAAGGMGVAGGTLLLTGIVAGPAVILAAVGAFWVARRGSKDKNEKVSAQLDEAEYQLQAQGPGYRAFCDIVPRATQTLDYLAVHGAHASRRWADRLPASQNWQELSASQREQYDDLVRLSAAQIAVATLDVPRLLTLTGGDLDIQKELMNQVVDQADELVRERV